jgi:cell wall-associated NlpC family hydrolase
MEMSQQELIERNRVVKIAHTWLKTKYHHEGRVKGIGIDCAMLIAEVYIEADLIPRTDIGHYSPDWHKNKAQERYMEVVLGYAREVDAPLPGDMALWQFGRTFSHGSLVIEWPLVIHAYIDQPCCLENVDQANWLKYRGEKDSKPRPVKFFRLKQWE